MSDRIVYVCRCGDYPQGIWFSKDVGTACTQCGRAVEAVNIDAPQRDDHIAAYNLIAAAVSKLADEVARLRVTIVVGGNARHEEEDG